MIVAQALGIFIFGGAAGALIAWLASRSQVSGLRNSLDRAERAGEKTIEALLERAKNELRETTAMRASERVGELVSPVAQKLGEFDRLLGELLGRTNQLENATVNLTTQTSTLVTALRNPASRGKWGEMQLRNVVEKAGMLPYCDFFEQQTVALEEARVRPDMTVNLPGERCVFVDAKAPLDSMQAALEATDEAARKRLVKQHARALRDHVDSLARRGYQTAEGSADFVVMFVAGEAFLGSACTEDPALIDYALDRSVLVTGPLALISLLRSFAMGWQTLRQEENAKRIATLGKVLYERALKFSEHLADLRRHLERSVNAFNLTVGSYESKLLPQGRKLKDEASLGGDELAEIPPIDVVPRDDHGARRRHDVEAASPFAAALRAGRRGLRTRRGSRRLSVICLPRL